MRITYNLAFKTLLSVNIQTYKDTKVKTIIYRRNGKLLLNLFSDEIPLYQLEMNKIFCKITNTGV